MSDSPCLFCTAVDIEKGAGITVRYNSSRADDWQEAQGKVTRVVTRRNGTCKVIFRRDDGQKMKVEANGRLHSYDSHAPTTGFASGYEVIDDYAQSAA